MMDHLLSRDENVRAKRPRGFALRTWLGFGVWCLLTSLLGAWMVAQHEIVLPEAAPQARLATGSRLLARHFLGVDCGCSQGVAANLIARRPRGGDWSEEVWLIGRDEELERRLRESGYGVLIVDDEKTLSEQGIQGAPWLALYSAKGELHYSGGYASGRPGTHGVQLQDGKLMAQVEQGGRPVSLPAYGCATSRELQRKLDPLGFKYSP